MTYDFTNFKGKARPLDELDIPRLAHRINVGEDEMRAFMEVEAGGSGFDSHGRPKMLFEPHVFYRNLSGEARDRAVSQGLAYRNWGQVDYPSDSYPRLRDAQKINVPAALMSCSWGAGQILGENYSTAGYTSIEQMVSAFMDDEEEHIEGMLRYVLANGIADDIRAHRWETVARVYNGPGYRKWGYHNKLRRAFQKWKNIPDLDWSPDREDSSRSDLPDGEALRQVQKRLREVGYHEVGKPDGVWGTRTRSAVLAFRYDHDLPLYAGVDDDMLSALMTSGHREVSETRKNTTAKELREQGSRTVKDADKVSTAGKATAGVGLLAGAGEVVDQVNEHVGTLGGLQARIEPIQSFLMDNIWLVLIAVGVFVIWKSGMIQKWRVEDQREGKNAGTSV